MEPAATSPGRVVDAYCDACMDVKPHDVAGVGGIKCRGCGRVGVTVAPEGKIDEEIKRPLR